MEKFLTKTIDEERQEPENTEPIVIEAPDIDPTSTTAKPGQKRKSTRDHKEQKKKYAKYMKAQLTGGEERITYTKLEKVFVEGETYDQMWVDGVKTDYMKCSNQECANKIFEDQVIEINFKKYSTTYTVYPYVIHTFKHFFNKGLKLHPARTHAKNHHNKIKTSQPTVTEYPRCRDTETPRCGTPTLPCIKF